MMNPIRISDRGFRAGNRAVEKWWEQNRESAKTLLGMERPPDYDETPPLTLFLYFSCASYTHAHRWPSLTRLPESRGAFDRVLRAAVPPGCYYPFFDQRVTRGKIEEFLQAGARSVGSRGRLLVVLQGHGDHFHDHEGESVYCFVPSDADPALLDAHGYPLIVLCDWFRKTKDVKHLALLCDFCHSEPETMQTLLDQVSRGIIGQEMDEFADQRMSRSLICTASGAAHPLSGGFLTHLADVFGVCRDLTYAFDRANNRWHDNRVHYAGDWCKPTHLSNGVPFPL